ncbi:hypothetical protein [Limosilactobacillus fermentum]|uniref:hypothetical protein n=1 Tax=Limosilactobacillus fermentum TaxID=1613 RepID=UPI001964A723|nr:hypothetical protein [Limosilactobacillus fermentum]MBM9559862.1 hypothetical protein [Limosilactobacillus fermentum]
MTAVTVAGLMVVVIWLVALKKRPAYPQALQEGWQSYIRQGMLSGAKLAPFFIAIGYFSNAFDGSPVALALSKVVGPNLSHLSWGLLFVIPVVIVLLALLGIHPLVSITLLGQVLLTSQVTIPTLAIALVLNVGGALSYLVSPFEGAIVLTVVLVAQYRGDLFLYQLKENKKASHPKMRSLYLLLDVR